METGDFTGQASDAKRQNQGAGEVGLGAPMPVGVPAEAGHVGKGNRGALRVS